MEKFDCPNCGQPMETTEDLAGQEVTCVSCGQKFVPIRITTRQPGLKNADGTIRRNARLIMNFAGLLAVIALLVFIGAMIEWHQDAAEGRGQDSGPFFQTAFWFLKAASCLFIVAQITHIRANTEK